MSREVRGSSVVVVGATSGLGRALTLSLAHIGARLTIVARDAVALEQVAAECRAVGAEAVAVPGDIAEPDVSTRIVEVATEYFGGVDTWVNCAAVLLAGRLEVVPIDEIADTVRIDVLGTALASRAALIHFGERGEGVLINVSSLLGLVPNPLVPAYVMSKFAVRGLSLSLHEAARGSKIRVCTVMPGPIDTPMFARAANFSGRQLRAIPPAVSPERAAAAVMRSIRRPRRQRTVGLLGSVLVVCHRVAPRLTESAVAVYAGTLLVRHQPAPPRPSSVAASVPAASAGRWRLWSPRARFGDALGRRQARRA